MRLPISGGSTWTDSGLQCVQQLLVASLPACAALVDGGKQSCYRHQIADVSNMSRAALASEAGPIDVYSTKFDTAGRLPPPPARPHTGLS